MLGLVVAEWLFELFPDEPEGQLSKRLNALVTGPVCAEVARGLGVRAHLRLGKQAQGDGAADSDKVLGVVMEAVLGAWYRAGGLAGARDLVRAAWGDRVARGLGVRAHLRLGKQARDDGAADSDNVLGDVMEVLIGAWYREAGLAAARDLVRAAWGDRVARGGKAPQHPKSALQEWAAANNRKAPEYSIVDRSGPGHAPVFTVAVAIGRLSAAATGGSKQEAETAAARALLEQVA